jgi:hypothetical protein
VVEHEADRTGHRTSHLSRQTLHANRPDRLNLARSVAGRRQRRKR